MHVVYKDTLGARIQKELSGLFPSVPMMVATLVAFAIVILILFFLLYKPIKKSIKARQDYIQSNIDQAKQTNDLSQDKLKEANDKLTQAHQEANNLVKNAKVRAEKVIISYTAKAKIESKRILEEAELDIKQQRDSLMEDSKNNIAKAASELSRQILKKEVSKKTESEIIDKFLES
ncbi:F0F1 ATP synthase subunit B [Mycoplasmopsis caviae]|uniref:ATP synthase subunit b n=1 Tax=Mycoplasmopsis caviae TaxID=55603 RepID=A0A3P8L7F6_9BACT|nr:F0F1 ATP synthase subunit B [Mycoplasmopsis caviae]UUD35008.1 F0F1 ATP synthase subunit B [Mycoplasmopsis caviae]VDR42165.1 ATP synthase subunit b [Mycoplasmopsis caviae]